MKHEKIENKSKENGTTNKHYIIFWDIEIYKNPIRIMRPFQSNIIYIQDFLLFLLKEWGWVGEEDKA